VLASRPTGYWAVAARIAPFRARVVPGIVPSLEIERARGFAATPVRGVSKVQGKRSVLAYVDLTVRALEKAENPLIQMPPEELVLAGPAFDAIVAGVFWLPPTEWWKRGRRELEVLSRSRASLCFSGECMYTRHTAGAGVVPGIREDERCLRRRRTPD